MRFWVFAVSILTLLPLHTSPVLAVPGYSPIEPSQLATDIDKFVEAGAVGYLVWHYSGTYGDGGHFGNDIHSFFQNDGTGPGTVCGTLQSKSSLPNFFVGVNIWDLGDPKYSQSQIESHFNWLKENCGVSVVRTFAYAGSSTDNTSGIQKVLSAAANTGIKIIFAIGDYSNGGGGVPKGAGLDWYKSGYEGEYLSFALAVASTVANNDSVFALELANEPHCGGDPSILPEYIKWADKVASQISYAAPIGIGQMASHPQEVCDNPTGGGDSGFAKSNSSPSLSYSSGHYYDNTAFNLNLAAARLNVKPFYVGEAGSGGALAVPQNPGEHSCTEFCSGKPYEPCSSTPQSDCSIPFDWNYILSPVEDQNELSDITRYLLGIFQHAIVPPGYHFTLGTNLKDPDKCRHISPTEIGKRNRCESATGGASISYIPQKTINTVTAPVDYVVGVIRNMYTTGFNFFADSLENTTLLDQGVIQRSLPPQIQWKNLAALEKLKERCYQMSKSQIEAGGRGRILDYIQDETFGSVRCANFISIDDPTGQYLTEREIFIEYERYGVLNPGPLFECVYQPTNSFSNQICEDLLFNSDNNISPKVVNVIRQLPQYPIATLPVIGATDRLAPEQDPNHSSLHPSLFQRTRSAISNLILDLQGSSSFSSQDLHTTYYLTTITAGQDTHLSTKLNAQTTLPRGILENQNNQVRTLDKPLLTALTQTFDGFLNQLTDSSDSPFHWRHIPDENKDPRMLAINLFFNRPENLAACLDTSQDSDHTPNERTLDYQGEIDQRVNLNVGGLLAKLFTLLNSEEGGVSSEHIENNNIDLQRFVDCRAYPNSLKAADIYSYETSQALLPHQDPNRTNEFVTLVNNPEDVTLEASGKIAPPTKTCSNSIENYENWKICLAYPVACSSITPRPEPPCCQLDGEVTDDPNQWQCVNNEPLTELEAKVEETSPNKGSTTFGGESIFSSVHNVFYKALNPVCNSKFTKAWDFFTKNECGVSLPPTTGTSDLCFYSGGFPIASQSFKQVIVSAANKHSVPIQLLLAMIQGENCRFKGGTENVCNLTQDQFFQPGVEYPASNNCTLPGSGSDPIPPASWDGLFKGFVTLNKFAHHNGPNGWVESRDPQFTNVCSIHDATFGIASVLAESYKKTQDSTPSSQNWTREQLEDVVVHWVTGQRKLNGCSTQASDLPSGGVWTPEVQNTALAGIKIFCGYLDQLYNPSDPLYVNTTCQ